MWESLPLISSNTLVWLYIKGRVPVKFSNVFIAYIYIQLKLYICTFRLIINFTKKLVISWDFHTFGELPTSGFQKKSCDFVATIKQFLVLPWGRGSLIVWVHIVRREQYICISNKTQAVSEPSPNKKVFFLFLPSLLNCWQSLQINLSGEIENSPEHRFKVVACLLFQNLPYSKGFYPARARSVRAQRLERESRNGC